MRHGNGNGRGRRVLQRGVIPAAAVAGAVLVAVGLATQESAPQAPSAGVSAGSAVSARPSTTRPPASTSPATHSGSHRRTQHESKTSHPEQTPKTEHTREKSSQSAPPSKHENSGKNKHAAKKVLPASKPVRLDIPDIDVNTAVTEVGRNSHDEIGVPKGKHINDAAWFDESPTPGQYGPSVVVGHIDTQQGRSVFFRLGELRHGDKIRVTRKDGTKPTFIVDKTRSYPDRNNLPVDKFLGGNVDKSGLRLVTCTDFDHSTGHYRGNTIV